MPAKFKEIYRMQRYEFQPVKTRDAVARVVSAFGQSMGAPRDLDALFRYLARLTPAQLEHFAREAGPAQIDMLCQFYTRAPGAASLVAIATVLCHRRDPRWSASACFSFFQLPEPGLLQRLGQVWLQHRDELSTPSQLTWMILWFESTNLPPVLDHVIECLRNRRFTLDRQDAVFFQTPLFQHLADWLFGEAGELITWLQQEPAGSCALDYLNRGDNERVRNYLRYYPQTSWPPSLLEEIYRCHGRPDRQASTFYAGLEEPTLWGFRKTLFSARMLASPSPKPQQAYWQARLHRCQEWKFVGASTEILLRPLQIRERLEETEVTLADGSVKRITHDGDYIKKMDALLNGVLGW